MLCHLLAGVFGVVIGSFLNVDIHRVPLKKSVVLPGSHCPKCNASIRAYDNIPVVSYLGLRGKCRNCGVRIPARYPAVELLTGCLFFLVALRFGITFELFQAFLLVSICVVLAATVLEHRLLPNAIVVPALVVGLALSVVTRTEWWSYPASALAAGTFLFLISALYPGGMGMGMGDVKMAAMLGCFLSPYVFLAVFFGALLGTLVSIPMTVVKKMSRKSLIPSGTFMAAGAIVVLFFGPAVWGGYLALFGA